MSDLDDATRRLAGQTIWNVGEWLEAHYDGLPYEMFNAQAGHGYRLTVERIPYQRRSPGDV